MFPSRPAHRVRAYRPRVEVLESRNLLSTYVVDSLTDTGAGSGLAGDLRYCMTQVTDGDTITFGVTGTIDLTGALPDLTHNISIDGPGSDELTVRRDTGGNYRIFTVDSGTTVSISGLTITNGLVGGFLAFGGGIENYGGTLTVSNCTISGNEAGQLLGDDGNGGGIGNLGTLTLSNSTVAGNYASAPPTSGIPAGGGIFNDGTLTVNNSTISGNTAYWAGIDYDGGKGGGIGNEGTLTLNNSTVAGNVAGGSQSYGGGIYNDGTLTLNNATVSGNSAFEVGGGIVNGLQYGGTVTLNNSTVSGNYYVGIANYDALTVNNATVSGNYDDGIDNYGALTLNNATVSGNYDYGIYNDGTLHALNTIIADNAYYDLGGNLGSLGHNLIGNTNGGTGFDDTDLLNVDPLLGPLQDNGGPTQTMALLPGSPALNAGDPAQLGVADQRGVLRSGGVNIGAYQASATAFLVNAPDTAQAGVPFDVTVTAVDPFGQVALGYTGTVTFSTSDGDPNVVLPADYSFTPDDQGTHTFSGGVTLVTPGDQTISATDTTDTTIVGSATVTVTGGAATPGRHRGADRVDALFAALAAEGSRRGPPNGSLAFWDGSTRTN